MKTKTLQLDFAEIPSAPCRSTDYQLRARWGNFTVTLYPDPDCENPCDYDESVALYTWEPGYRSPSANDFSSPAECLAYAEREGLEVFPLHKYEHGGREYSITEFSCPWDSGQVGYALVRASDVPDPEAAARIACETYSAWCNGDCWGYEILQDGEATSDDSCCGLIGQEYAQREATDALACILANGGGFDAQQTPTPLQLPLDLVPC